MTDWLSAGAMLLAGIIVGVVFLYAMKTRRKDDGGDAELRDLEAKRDALVVQLRELADDPEETKRLEHETANVLRRIDERKTRVKKKDERPEAVLVRRAQLTGFAWGVGSVLVIGGIFWYVTQKAQPKSEETAMQQGAPMQQQQQPAQQAPQSDPQVQAMEAAVAQRPDDLVLRNQLSRAYLDRENLMGVFQQTQYVLQRQPNDPQALTYQSLVRMAMGQTDSASTMLHQAIKSDPKFLDAYVALAWAQTTAGKSDDAAATMTEAKKQHPEQARRLDDVLVKMRQTAKNQPAQTADLPPNHPAIEGAGAPGSAPAASGGGEAVHVTLALAAGTAPPQRGFIFVIARAAGVSAGPPAAVKRLPLSALPLTFDLSSADSMMGQPLPPKIRIEARVDSDGDPLTRDPKDPTATADNVATGSSVTLTLH